MVVSIGPAAIAEDIYGLFPADVRKSGAGPITPDQELKSIVVRLDGLISGSLEKTDYRIADLAKRVAQIELESELPEFALELELPFVSKDDVSLTRAADENTPVTSP